MHVLSTTQVFPNASQPVHGVFVRERLTRLAAHVDVEVIAPVPYFPGARLLRPHYRPPAPAYEEHGPLAVWHPRFFSFPGVLKWLDGVLFYLSCRATARRLDRRHGIDVVDAHFVYPDAVGAALLANALNVPLVVTMRGGNIKRFKSSPSRRFQVVRALRRAQRVIVLSESLREDAIELGVDPGKVRLVPNGVDLELFRPQPRATARDALGLPTTGKVVVSVGHLVPRKGFHRVIEVLPRLVRRYPGLRYVIVGGPGVEGDARRLLERSARSRGIAESVTMVGPVDHRGIARYLSAADVVCLPSDDEGCPNIVLESLACGTPVVASRVGGVAEIVNETALGITIPPGDADALEAALAELLSRPVDRERCRQRVLGSTWEAVASSVIGILREAVADSSQAVAPRASTR